MADPALKFEPNTAFALRGTLTVTGVTTNYTIHFGDGFAKAGRPDQEHDYKWPSAGAYTAVVVRDGEREPFVKKEFRVLPEPHPRVTLEASPEVDHTARLTFNDPADGPVGRFTVTWAKGEDSQEVLGVPGSYIEHYYATAGQHPVLIQDRWSGYRVSQRVTIPEPVIDPDATVAGDAADPSGYTAKVEVTHSSGAADRMLTVEWGDGASEEISAAIGTEVSHEYDFDGDYLIWLYYSDDPDGKVKFLPVAVPFEAA